jgi:peptide-methionine (S)-S-oxide reductase
MALAGYLARLPEGYSEGMFDGQRYRLEKTTFNGGRIVKFYARALGGADYVSLNLYHLAHGEALKPCEMPEAKVRNFLARVVLV